MKTSKLLGVALIVLEVASVALFLVCGQTIFSLLGTVTPGGGEIPVSIDQQTQIATLTFTFTPRNSGLIAANVNVGFGVTLTDGSYSVKNTTTVNLPPGTQEAISLTIKVPVEKLQEYANAKGTLDIYTSIRTLNDLVKLDYNAKSEGGG
ncbi:MAG: hypothetical protein NTV61_09895 [Candidatus Bathyarchaeota archaeon]|nr:hypothetical protein [Candidatus Bathyarchaeota archaeon]